MGSEVLESLTPAQQIIKIVNDELTALMGSDQRPDHLLVEDPHHHHDVRPSGCR